jgi:hypothetical protein
VGTQGETLHWFRNSYQRKMKWKYEVSQLAESVTGEKMTKTYKTKGLVT